jgi:CHAT domain-containing protein
MANASDVKWTLWVYAGPGAISDIGAPPAGVALLAETVGAPTLLQQLTGEWPARRLALGLDVDVPPAERNLWRFLEWADNHTPKGSKRALIVLGDLLRAIGEAPKPVVAGVYRPPYPSIIKVKKGNNATAPDNWSSNSLPTPSYALGTTSKSAQQLIDMVKSNDKWAINFGEVTNYNHSLGWTYDKYYLWDAPNRQWVAGGYESNVFQYHGPAYTDIKEAPTATDPNNKIVTTIARSIDAVGPAEVDPSARRIDALAAALDGRSVALLATDNRELTQIAALRRLSAPTKVLLGAARTPLAALLDALRDNADPSPELLAKRAIAACGQGAVAVRSSKAPGLLAALDTLAGQVLFAGQGSTLMATVGDACRAGGDLSRLTKPLRKLDAIAAGEIEACASKIIVARGGPAPSSDAEPTIGINLDDTGLQLGPSSGWTSLLDKLGGHADADVLRRTLVDLQVLTVSERRASHGALASSAQVAAVLEYSGPAPDVEASGDFKRFVGEVLDRNHGVRHLALIVRGRWTPARSGCVTLDLERGKYLRIATLARCLRNELSRRGRGPLAAIIFEDPELLRIENAYELREVADVLLTASAGSQLPATEWLTKRMLDVVARCEQHAADALGITATDSIVPHVRTWRRDVAVRLADLLVTSDPKDTGPVALQGIDLRHIETLCRLFDRLCQRMFDNLDDPSVLAATHAGNAASLVEWINGVQMQGFWPFFQQGQASALAVGLHNDWGELYDWIAQSETARREGGAPFWIAPNFTEDRAADGYCSRLRISVGPHQPKCYRMLSFHQDVSFQALLAAARMLGGGGARQHWGLIKLGLAYAPLGQCCTQLEQLIAEPSAAHYFSALGDPPLLSFAIEKDQNEKGYVLSLQSSESQAALVRKHRVVDLQVVDRSLEGLTYVLSRSMASREGQEYLEGLGASLAEDVINDLREQLESARTRVLQTGRSSEAHLALELAPELMRYPWELMQMRVEDRYEMLAERFAVGRQMWSDRDVRPVRSNDSPIRVLIIADPQTTYGDLPAARIEGRQIQELCEAMSRDLHGKVEFDCDVSIGQLLTSTVLRQRVRTGNYDVLHFAGHGTFDARHPERSGWALTDRMLTVAELSNTLASCATPPWLIYANACSAGMFGEDAGGQYHGDVHGMAEACIRAGVSAYVAPLWRIHDESARLLANEFYRRLLLERSTVGVALQRARMQVRKTWAALRGDTGLGDVSWAGMMLFGNPGVRLRGTAG